MSTTTRTVRVVRGTLAAAVAVHTAAFFHVAGGGVPPAPVAVALTLAFAVPLSIALAGPSRPGSTPRVAASAPRTALSVATSQALLHVLFTLGASGTPPGGHVHAGGSLALPVLAGVVPPMWQAHALAAGVTVAALLLGSRALDGLARCIRLAVRRILARALAPAPLPAARVRASSRPALTDRLAAVCDLRRRGPPAASALLA
ncbi:MAG: hypothetical protein JWP66_1738 [Naasia sp.]|nr:hypothetical protein [Naasia sp.]